LGWHFFSTDSPGTGFNIYRSETSGSDYHIINSTPIVDSTNYIDSKREVSKNYYYIVKPINHGAEGRPSNEAIVTGQNMPIDYALKFKTPGYTMLNLGDLDGNGLFDFITQEPRIVNADRICPGTELIGTTDYDCFEQNRKLSNGETYQLAAYNDKGQFLWRFDTHLGQSAKDSQSPHSTNFTVFDLDKDGMAEVITIIKDDNDYKLARLDGRTGNILNKSEAFPSYWMQDSSNDYFRIYLAVAYLDGGNPSIVLQPHRGRGSCGNPPGDPKAQDSRIVAFDKNLNKLWEATGGDCIAGHGIEVLDADDDGKDEILMGDNLIDDNGTLKWSRRSGHVDVMAPGDIDPENPGLEIFFGWETNAKMELVSARNGQVLWTIPNKQHIDSGAIANLTSHAGLECIAIDIANSAENESSKTPYLINAQGKLLSNPRIWGRYTVIHWSDDDISNFLVGEKSKVKILTYNRSVIKSFNETFSHKWEEPLAVDILGDWRDEVILQGDDGTLYVFTNTNLAKSRKITPLQDRLYRLGLTKFNQGYYKSLNRSGVYFDMRTQTCNEQGGNTCGPEETCSGNWLSISNADLCCDGNCIARPPTITDVAAISKENSSTIIWNTDQLATSQVEYGLTKEYQIKSSLDPEPLFTSSHSIELKGLNPETTYHYKVISMNKNGLTGTTSMDSTFTTLPDERANLSIPMGLQATPENNGLKIKLKWNKYKNDEGISFIIQRRVNSNLNNNAWKTIKILSKDQTSYTDTELAPETTYYYRIKVGLGQIYSKYSKEVSATTVKDLLKKPLLNKTIIFQGNNVALSWTVLNEDISGVELQRRLNSSEKKEWTIISTLPKGRTFYEDSSIKPGRYDYRVRSRNGNQVSEYSNIRTVQIGKNLKSGRD